MPLRRLIQSPTPQQGSSSHAAHQHMTARKSAFPISFTGSGFNLLLGRSCIGPGLYRRQGGLLTGAAVIPGRWPESNSVFCFGEHPGMQTCLKLHYLAVVQLSRPRRFRFAACGICTCIRFQRNSCAAHGSNQDQKKHQPSNCDSRSFLTAMSRSNALHCSGVASRSMPVAFLMDWRCQRIRIRRIIAGLLQRQERNSTSGWLRAKLHRVYCEPANPTLLYCF